jgi:hypothetical protein
MNDEELVKCFLCGLAGLWVGYLLGQRKALLQQQQQTGASDGTGAAAMDWFTAWGKGL